MRYLCADVLEIVMLVGRYPPVEGDLPFDLPFGMPRSGVIGRSGFGLFGKTCSVKTWRRSCMTWRRSSMISRVSHRRADTLRSVCNPAAHCVSLGRKGGGRGIAATRHIDDGADGREGEWGDGGDGE